MTSSFLPFFPLFPPIFMSPLYEVVKESPSREKLPLEKASYHYSSLPTPNINHDVGLVEFQRHGVPFLKDG